MGENLLSLIFVDTTNKDSTTAEQGSVTSTTSCRRPRSRAADQAVMTNASSTTARFKGVVAQHNGHWGAQIYTNHQRIWLGTFNSENEAAMAYDSASIKLRSGDSYRNFPWSNQTVEEAKFQKLYSRETILNMIKDGSYQSRFWDYVEKNEKSGDDEKTVNEGWNKGKLMCRQLFEKELTPSDVGKLNRLVIPKRYAEKYFPGMSEDEEVILYDKMMRKWKLRYCYWRSSQSYVFTRGWKRFVKEKKLEANDIVRFYEEEMEKGALIFLIDVIYKKERNGGNNDSNVVNKDKEMIDEEDGRIMIKRRCSIRLFGVEISTY